MIVTSRFAIAEKNEITKSDVDLEDMIVTGVMEDFEDENNLVFVTVMKDGKFLFRDK